jgi:hypothetical protein
LQFYVNAVNLEDIDYTWTDPQGRVLSGSAVYNLKVTQSGTYKCTVWDRYDNTAYAYFVINNGLTSIAKTQIKLSGYSFKYTGKHIEPSAAVTLNGKTYVKGSDYTVEYVDNVNAGTDAAVVIKGNEKTLTGIRKVHFTINKADQTPKMSVKNVTAGKTSTFAVTGSYGTITAKSDNKAIATVSVSGKNVAVKGIKAGETKIKIKASGDSNHNASKEISYTVKVVLGATTKFQAEPAASGKGIKLTWAKVPGANSYEIYRNNKKVKTTKDVATWTDAGANANGTKYTFKIKAKNGKYVSTQTKSVIYYKVNRPGAPKVTNSASKKMTVKWGKIAKTNGYQIQYGLKKNFKGAKSVNVPKYNTVSKVIGGLAKGKTYYVRVRAYKKASGKTYYSAWSNAKTLKIKK